LHILAHDDCICYLSDATNPAPRCSRGRMHFFVEAWMGHNAIGEDFYVFKYRGFKAGSFVSLGSLQSLEKVLRQLDQHLSKKANKNKKVGDLVILTHGVSYYVNQQLQTVKMQLPIFDPSARRVIPTWTLPNEIDAAELKKLTTTGSDYYSYVDGPKVRDGLVSKVLKRIKTHIDGQTHIWLTGCSLGLNPQLLAEVRRFFGGHPVVYAFTKKHFLRIWTNADGDVTSGRETLADGQRRVGVWTSEGTQWIKHVP